MEGMREMRGDEIDGVSGGNMWIAVVVYEVIDIITSAGENLKTAFENGKEAAK